MQELNLKIYKTLLKAIKENPNKIKDISEWDDTKL